ncbi:hypothetical protein [uncultured Porphyromonas sp.]|uniref:hypothetical protein n=1 Tax=uncultured Porphyromonas sp. TaxID=159274 RepID=UPI00259BC0B3|nr:hypothetical protein [uncultured Porphyromonas sp.]
MKNILSKGLILVMALFALTSCDKDQPNEEQKEVPNLVVELSEATLQPNQSLEIPIKSGSGNYLVSIPQIGIATASVTKESVTLTGIKIGETLLTITDKVSRQSKEIKVSIEAEPVLKLSHRELKTSVGATSIVTILNGSSKYKAELSDPALGTYYFQEQNFVFTAKKVATGTITIKDTELGFTKSINVEITPTPLLLNTYDITIPTGDCKNISITSGSGDYTITCDKPELVKIVVNRNTIILTATAVGEGTITVKDNITEQVKEIKLTTTLQPFVTSIDDTDELTVYFYEGSEKNVQIYTGNGNYEIVVEDEEVITATLVNKTVKLIPHKEGESLLTIKDIISGKEVSTKVVVKAPQQLIVFSQQKVIVNAGSSVTIRIIENNSGRNNWSLYFNTVNTSIAMANKSWWGDDITIYGQMVGQTTLLVKDDYGNVYGSLAIEVI